MPHDMIGQKIGVGDRVSCKVKNARYLKVQKTEASGDEYTPDIVVIDEPAVKHFGEVKEVYAQEDACNIEVQMDRGIGTVTCNSKLFLVETPADAQAIDSEEEE